MRPPRLASAGTLFAILLAVAACAGPTSSAPPPDVGSAPPVTVEPSATPRPSTAISDLPDGPLVRVDQVNLSDDGLTVTMRFTGSKIFDATDPCSRAYGGFAAVNGDVLEIAVVEAPHPMVPAEGTACDAMGHARVAEAVLPEPFTGTEIRDLAGGSFLVGAPEGFARFGGLPEGWTLDSQGDVPDGTVARWRQTFVAPGSDEVVGGRPGAMDLYQSFDGPIEVTGGDQRSDVVVNGQPAVLYRHPPNGELVLTWAIGDDGFALVANATDFEADALISLAETVALD